MFQKRIPCIGQKLGTVLVYLEPSEAATHERTGGESQKQQSLELAQIEHLNDERVPERTKDDTTDIVKERRKLLSVA